MPNSKNTTILFLAGLALSSCETRQLGVQRIHFTLSPAGNATKAFGVDPVGMTLDRATGALEADISAASAVITAHGLVDVPGYKYNVRLELAATDRDGLPGAGSLQTAAASPVDHSGHGGGGHNHGGPDATVHPDATPNLPDDAGVEIDSGEPADSGVTPDAGVAAAPDAAAPLPDAAASAPPQGTSNVTTIREVGALYAAAGGEWRLSVLAEAKVLARIRAASVVMVHSSTVALPVGGHEVLVLRGQVGVGHDSNATAGTEEGGGAHVHGP